MSKKIKTQSIISAQSEAEAVSKIREIGDLEREKKRLEAEMNDQIAQLQETYKRKVAQLDEGIVELTESVHLWCEANRAKLTDNNRVKYADLTTGIVKWRINSPSVVISGKDDVIERLQSDPNLKRFVREKYEINRELILQYPELFDNNQFKGIKIKSGEEYFVIEPFNQELGA